MTGNPNLESRIICFTKSRSYTRSVDFSPDFRVAFCSTATGNPQQRRRPFSAKVTFVNCSNGRPTGEVTLQQISLDVEHLVGWLIMVNNLVGGLEHEFYFSIYLGIITRTDFHIFQDGGNHQPVNNGYNNIYNNLGKSWFTLGKSSPTARFRLVTYDNLPRHHLDPGYPGEPWVQTQFPKAGECFGVGLWMLRILPDAVCCPDNIENVVLSNIWYERLQKILRIRIVFQFRIQSFQILGFRVLGFGVLGFRMV